MLHSWTHNNFSPALKFTLSGCNCYSTIVINQIVQSEVKLSVKQDDSFSHTLRHLTFSLSVSQIDFRHDFIYPDISSTVEIFL